MSASRLLLFVLVLTNAASMVAAQMDGWAPSECQESIRAAQQRGAIGIRSAARGEPDWVPFPFSTKPAEIVENFLVRHRLAYADLTGAQMPTEEALLFRLADEKRLDWDVVAVADWTPMRCAPSQPRESFWLIRLFEHPRRNEIARVTVAESGLVKMIRFNGPESRQLGSLLPLSADRLDDFGADRSSAQYVHVVTSLLCAAIDPCVAWQSDEGVLVQARDALVLVPRDRADLRLDGELSKGSGSPLWKKARERGEHIVSLGGNIAAYGRVVGPGVPWGP